MDKKFTVADYMSWLNTEKSEIVKKFLDYAAAKKTDKTQEDLYNTLTIEELENYD